MVSTSMLATASPPTSPSAVCSTVYDQPQEMDYWTSRTQNKGYTPHCVPHTDAAKEIVYGLDNDATERIQPALTLDTSTIPTQLQHCPPLSTQPPEPLRTRPSLRSKVTEIFKRRGSPNETQSSPLEGSKQACSHSPTISASDEERRKSTPSTLNSLESNPISLEQVESQTIYNRPRVTVREPSENNRDHNRPRASTSFRGTISNLLSPEPKLERCYTGALNTAGAGTKSRRMSMVVPAECFDIPVKPLSDEFRTWPQTFSILGWSITKIGKGTTANVHKRHKKISGKAFAVKEFRPMDPLEDDAYYKQKIKSEAAIAMSVDHPNVVRTSMLCTDHGKWFLVMEHCTGGDLFSLIQQKYLSKDHHAADRYCIFKQIIQAVDYLHSQGIAHRDIKPDNILIDANSHVKITDFGSSEVFRGQHPAMRFTRTIREMNMGEIRLCEVGICGSVPYLPPEVLERKDKYDPRLVDVWGVATVMLCMSFSGYLWEKAEPGNSQFYDSLVAGWAKWYEKHPQEPNPKTSMTDYPNVKIFDAEIKPPALRRLLLNMLHPNPTKRCSITEVVNSPYIKGIECCATYVPPIDPDNPPQRKAQPIYRTHDHYPNPRDKIRRRPTR